MMMIPADGLGAIPQQPGTAQRRTAPGVVAGPVGADPALTETPPETNPEAPFVDGLELGGLPPTDGVKTGGKAAKPATESPEAAVAAPAGDAFVPSAPAALKPTALPARPGAPPGQATALGGLGVPSNGYDSVEDFPPHLAEAFECLCKAPFGKPGQGTVAGMDPKILLKQYQMVPQDLLKRAPAVFLFLNTIQGKYPPSEILRLASTHGVDLAKVVTSLVLDGPARPEVVAKLAGDHQLGADRPAVLRQAEEMANSKDPMQQLAGKFTKAVLGNNPQALQAMLIDPMVYFGAQFWNQLRQPQQKFVADGAKARQATGLLQRGGMGARGLTQTLSGLEDQQQGEGEAAPQPANPNELQAQKAFYDGWRANLIKGIKEATDQANGRVSAPPRIALVAGAAHGPSRALYDPTRRSVRLASRHSTPEIFTVQTSGLTLLVATDGEILEIAVRNPLERWHLEKALAPPVVAGLEPGRARIVEPSPGLLYATHDRFFTSSDRNVIRFQIEKRPVARRLLGATNLVFEVDSGDYLLAIVIWQLSAARPPSTSDRQAFIKGLAGPS